MESNESKLAPQTSDAKAPGGGVTLRACKNALARLKLQMILRLCFVAVALIPLLCGFIAWRMYLVAIALVLQDIPAFLLTLKPDFGMGVFNTQRAYDCIDYPGFFTDKKLDRFLTPPFAGKKKIGVYAFLFFFGWYCNLRQIVKLTADYIDITRCFPKNPDKRFSARWKRFRGGLGMVCAVFLVWCAIAGTLAGALADVVGTSHGDPYTFRSAVDEKTEDDVLYGLSSTLRDRSYFYYVNIPFNENGFAAQGATGKQSASYLACITHQLTTQESWQVTLTLTDERSAAWREDADVVHPIRFDTDGGSESVYFSGEAADTVYYRDASGTYVQSALDGAPESYQALARYILLTSDTVSAMLADDEHTAADGASGIVHIRYETDAQRITVGMKDDYLPFEASVTEFADNFSFKTEAIRFEAVNNFTLPL